MELLLLITNLNDQTIKDYCVQVKLPVDLFFPSRTGENLTIIYQGASDNDSWDISSNILKSKLQLTYNTDNKKYKFEIIENSITDTNP